MPLVALLLVLVTGPSIAAAAPTLVSPANNAKLSPGGNLQLVWSGGLQGHPDARERSYFRVEVAPQQGLPSGANAPWPQLEHEILTDPGEAATQASVGRLPAGKFRWRVCAMGVVDPDVSNAIVNLGCSASRGIQAAAATTTAANTQRLVITEEIRTQAPARTIRRPATPTAPAPAPEPAPEPPRPIAAPPEPEPEPTSVDLTSAVSGSGTSPISLNFGGMASGDLLGSALMGGLAGALLRGLGAEVPILGVPFWALLLPLLGVPLAIWFGRSTRRMYDLGPATASRDAAATAGSTAGSAPSQPGTGHGTGHVQETVKSRAAPADGAREIAA